MPRNIRRFRSESRSCSPSTRPRDDRATSPASPPLRRRRRDSTPPTNSPPRTRSTRLLEERVRELEAAVAANTQTPATTENPRSQNTARNGNRPDQQRGRQRTRWVMFGLNIPIGEYTPMCRVHREVACTHCIYFVTNRPYPQPSQMAIED